MLGERVLIARQAEGMTQKGLSESSGISPSKISKIETDMTDPTPSEIHALSSALSIPFSYFTDSPSYPVVEGRFRKRSRAPKSRVRTLVSTTAMIAGVVQEASAEYRLRPVTITPFDGEATENAIADQTLMTRTALGLPSRGPIGNVIRACERGGIAVARVPMADDGGDLSGYSVWGDMGELRPLIVFSSSLPGDVLRATVSHELGHLVLHTLRPLVEPKAGEVEAWGFSNHFLFPVDDAKEIFAGTPVTLRSLLRVKQRYGVSVSFLISCCRRYGIIDELRERSLRKQYSARGWYMNEPGEVVGETTKMVPAILSRMREDGRDICLQEFLTWKLMTAA